LLSSLGLLFADREIYMSTGFPQFFCTCIKIRPDQSCCLTRAPASMALHVALHGACIRGPHVYAFPAALRRGHLHSYSSSLISLNASTFFIKCPSGSNTAESPGSCSSAPFARSSHSSDRCAKVI